MKIIDNILSEKELEYIKTKMMHNQEMPWYFNDAIATDRENDPMYYFTHNFFLSRGSTDQFKYEKSDWFHIIRSILDFIKPKVLIRSKGNMYPSTSTIVYHDSHIDLPYEHVRWTQKRNIEREILTKRLKNYILINFQIKSKFLQKNLV